MTATPSSLLEQLRRPGNQAAWVRFVHLYTPLLWRWLARRGVRPTDAADLIQDIFVVLVQKMPEFTYDRKKSFRAWLHTITLNKWRDRLRARVPIPLDDGEQPLADLEAGGVEDAFDQTECSSYLAARALRLIQAEFQEPTWRAFWECVVAGRPGAEVARELGLTTNAVYLARGRVLRRLREELDGLLD
jgi:RNA polymerase sigma-70 factor (ECF subfamily)